MVYSQRSISASNCSEPTKQRWNESFATLDAWIRIYAHRRITLVRPNEIFPLVFLIFSPLPLVLIGIDLIPARRANLSIQRLFTLIFGAIIAITTILSFLVVAMINNQRSLSKSEENRYQSYLLADELRQSSDDLSRMARTFAVTGESRYATLYQQILSIRNGQEPRPSNYSHPYIDFLAAGQKVDSELDSAVTLLELMRRQGMSEAELDKLKEAEHASNELVNLESQAIDTALGANGMKPDLSASTRLVYSPRYDAEKARIVAPVKEFFVLLDKRTQLEVDHLRATGSAFMTAVSVMVFLLIVIAVIYNVIFLPNKLPNMSNLFKQPKRSDFPLRGLSLLFRYSAAKMVM